MAARTAAELVVDVVTDATKATAGFDAVESSAGSMERSIKSAGDTAEKTSRQIGISADAADELGGKAGKATGALGALSSGFELVGAEKYATALQGAGLATDFMSGVGDSLNLVMESTIIKNIRATAATVAHKAATAASAAATGAMTAAQWALNAALNANPVALIVLAVVALVGVLLLAYRRSDRVRAIIDAVGRVGRQAIGFVVDKTRELVSWFGQRIPAAAGIAKTLVLTYFRVMTTGPRLLIAAVTTAVGWVRDTLPAAFNTAKTAASRVADTITAPFRAVRDVIERIIELIGKIKLPKLSLPNIPGLRVVGGSGGGGGGTSTTTVNYYTIQLPDGLIVGDVNTLGAAIEVIMSRYARRI